MRVEVDSARNKRLKGKINDEARKREVIRGPPKLSIEGMVWSVIIHESDIYISFGISRTCWQVTRSPTSLAGSSSHTPIWHTHTRTPNTSSFYTKGCKDERNEGWDRSIVVAHLFSVGLPRLGLGDMRNDRRKEWQQHQSHSMRCDVALSINKSLFCGPTIDTPHFPFFDNKKEL